MAKTVRLRFITSCISTTYGNVKAGMVAEYDEKTAAMAIKHGLAVKVLDDKTDEKEAEKPKKSLFSRAKKDEKAPETEEKADSEEENPELVEKVEPDVKRTTRRRKSTSKGDRK